MRKLFEVFPITGTVGSPLYRPGDRAFGIYFYRKLLPNTTVFISNDALEGVYTVAHVEGDQVWLIDTSRQQKQLGPFPIGSVKAVMILRLRPRK